jgi:hypothetical protein
MSKIADELRNILAWSYDEDAMSEAIGLAADLLDEAEKALVDMAGALLAQMESEGFDPTCCDSPLLDRLCATLARIRGEPQ